MLENLVGWNPQLVCFRDLALAGCLDFGPIGSQPQFGPLL